LLIFIFFENKLREISKRGRNRSLQTNITATIKPVGVGVLGVPFINKKRVFGTGEVSENSSLEKLLFLKIGSKDSRGRLSLQN
jgi:hypothetical protein